MSKAAMKLALEALEWINRINAMDYEYQQKARESLNAIYEELAEQPAQHEPVKHELQCICGCSWEIDADGNEELVSSPPAQQQEPVAWATRMGEYAHIHWGAKRPEYPMVYEVPLYTSPPASKPWVGLTQQEQASVLASVPTVPFEGDWHLALFTAIEAKLKEKNA